MELLSVLFIGFWAVVGTLSFLSNSRQRWIDSYSGWSEAQIDRKIEDNFLASCTEVGCGVLLPMLLLLFMTVFVYPVIPLGAIIYDVGRVELAYAVLSITAIIWVRNFSFVVKVKKSVQEEVEKQTAKKVDIYKDGLKVDMEVILPAAETRSPEAQDQDPNKPFVPKQTGWMRFKAFLGRAFSHLPVFYFWYLLFLKLA